MKILDACCGSRRFWFKKNDPDTTYMDIRREKFEIYGKKVDVDPTVLGDFRKMPFKNELFDLIVFDPPHLKWAGQKSIMKAQYGQLDKDTWPFDLKEGMYECQRVLKKNGTLIFKWNETQIKLNDVLDAMAPFEPIFGDHRAKTHWLVFKKELIE